MSSESKPTGPSAPNPPAEAAKTPPAVPPKRSRWRAALRTLGIALGTLAVVGAAGLAGAEYHTSRPQFCASCHVMEPYYESWSHDLHGSKLGVRCVDCHYAPGERFTIKAKFKGLSQVASYFSGRYGAGRPRAHVNDESCLRSGCHGDGAFRGKQLLIGQPRTEVRMVDDREVEVPRTPSVHFYHEKHLDVDEKLAANTADIAARQERLASSLGGAAAARVFEMARSVAPAEQRNEALRGLLTELGASDDVRADARGLMDLEHRHTRLRQLEGIACAGCHSYDPSGKGHLAVNVNNCFTCHFTNEAFNHGTGECLKCHEAPARAIFVHGPSALARGAVLMDHRDIVARGVDCASCHLDVVRGAAPVTERECRHCHDRDAFLEGFATRTTATVEEYHAAHVAKQRARCDDCHKTITHALLDPMRLTSTGFLEPVINDCQHCHPGHHTEQVQLLAGVGGAGLARSTPNAMLGSRLNCRACHTLSGADTKGDSLIRATEKSCIACHSNDYATLFAQWQHEIEEYLNEAKTQLARVDALVKRLGEQNTPPSDELMLVIEQARQNIHLVDTGGGMHNKHFALQLLEAARSALTQVEQKLAKPQ